jgi:pimeloyl-ACP methyl ester carboxylesterase
MGASPGNGRHKIVLSAHSMGGLIAMSALDKLAEQGFPPSVKMYCSFSTPYGGIESARTGLENAPAVVPAWRDIAPGSDFLKDLTGRRLPETLPFYLYFAYNNPSMLKGGVCGDGSVPLYSQLEPSVQKAATRIMGFNETHVGVLNSTDARESFLRLLDTIEPPLSGGPR